MGPGYFPRILGILLIVLGSIITLRGVRVPASPICEQKRTHARTPRLARGSRHARPS